MHATQQRTTPIQVIHNAYTPKEAIEISSRAGNYKARMRVDKIIFSSFLGGAFLSFGCASYIVINASPWYVTNAPGKSPTMCVIFVDAMN